MTNRAIRWLRDHATERGLHNYAQWIEEHAAAALAIGDEPEMSDELAAVECRAAELTDLLAAERLKSAELEQHLADLTASSSAPAASGLHEENPDG